jgi:hypothetical protein
MKGRDVRERAVIAPVHARRLARHGCLLFIHLLCRRLRPQQPCL